MWHAGRQKHCTDEELLAHVDGELTRRPERAVCEHLRTCWECRSRLSELEAQAEHLARLAASPDFPSVRSAAEAKARFLSWRADLERSLAQSPVRRAGGPFRISWKAALAAAACALAAWAVLAPRRQSAPDARAALEQAQRAERISTPGSTAVHQVFQVELRESRPAARSTSGQVEIWSDRAGSRYASRWTDRGGTIKYAVWQNAPSKRYQYDAALAPQIVPAVEKQASWTSVLDLPDYDLERLESAFLKWIRERAWLPVSISADFAVFAAGDGVVLRSETIRSGGIRMLRLTAERSNQRVRIEFALDLDENSRRPRVQTIRFQTSERMLELRVRALKSESLRPEALLPAVFEPPLPGLSIASASLPTRPPAAPPVQALTPRTEAARADLDSRELEVWSALHRAHACLTEVVSVKHGQAGRFRIEGIAATPDRRLHLLAILQGLAAAPLLDIDISVGRSAQSRGVRPASGAVPARALQSADTTYLEALALVRLAERFGGPRAAHLNPPSGAALAEMLRDHAVALRTASASTRQLLQPVLDSLDPGASAPFPAADEAEATSTGWSEACFALFRDVDQMDELTQALGDGGAARQAASALPHVFARMGVLLDVVETTTSRQNAGAARVFGNDAGVR